LLVKPSDAFEFKGSWHSIVVVASGGELARLSRDGHLPKERVVNLSRVRTTCGSGWVELEKRADQLTLETHNTQTSFVFFRVVRGYAFFLQPRTARTLTKQNTNNGVF